MAVKEMLVPDIGDFEEVDVIEVLVAPGDSVKPDDSILTLESDKATMELPSPFAGRVKELKVAVGDKVAQGSPVLTMEVEDTQDAHSRAQPDQETEEQTAASPDAGRTAQDNTASSGQRDAEASSRADDYPPPPAKQEDERPALRTPHASPSVRRVARELGVDLQRVRGSGPKGRILKDDVQSFVKGRMQQTEGPAPGSLPEIPSIDFSQYGDIETRKLSRIQRISGPQLHRNWISIPHVTQFDEADITELEAFRKAERDTLAKRGTKLTLLAFVLKAATETLKRFPQVNASLAPDGEQLILKKYYHIGVAVDTAEGLVVPVVRDVDRKGIAEIARELGELSQRARDRQLKPSDMQGGSFTVSSLGGLGGTGFTPIINAPEVAILGLSRATMRPVYRDSAFVPRLMLPLALSYDHRAIDGADAVRFTAALSANLSDIRRLLL